MPDVQSLGISIEKIKNVLQAEVIIGDEMIDTEVRGVYASDLMSDVLAYGKEGSALLTGLNTIQSVISAYMAEFKSIIFIRGKKPAADVREFAKEKGLILLSTKADMFEACVRISRLSEDSVLPDMSLISTREDKYRTIHEFKIDGHDFSSAGMVSTQIKSILKTIGYDPQLIRRVAISTYEGEMNIIMHAHTDKAKVILNASDDEIIVNLIDDGKGIPDVERAMEEGYSTATDEQRALGFGAGMGLPNIKKNSDVLKLISEVGKGTTLEVRFFVKE
jgi:anti-sigma regulatory factor (Ser/Thr protein kinase)